jgi:rubrerythrin
VGWFCAGYSAYFAQDAPPPNGLTQFMRYRLLLTKRRLQARGVRLVPAFQSRLSTAGTAPPPPMIAFDDGPFVYEFVFAKLVKLRQEWITSDGGRTVHEQKGTHHFALASTGRGDGLYACPQCGAVGPTETLMAGCPYCHSQFKLEDFTEKVAACGRDKGGRWMSVDPAQRGFSLALLVAVITMMVFALGGCAAFVALALSGGGPSPALSWVAAAVFGGIAVALVAALPQIVAALRRRSNRLRFEAAAKAADGAFSLESLLESVDNKLALIHLADSQQQVSAFAKCDLTSLLPTYQDVLDTEILDVTYGGYQADGAWVYANLTATLELDVLQGKQVARRQEKVRLTLGRLAHGPRRQAYDLVVFTCATCGAPVELEQYGICAHCGTPLALEHHDWVITAYQPA